MPIADYIMKTTKRVYVSMKRGCSGIKWDNLNNCIVKDYTYHIKRRTSKYSIIIYSLNLLLHLVLPIAYARCFSGFFKFAYIFVVLVLGLIAFFMWYTSVEQQVHSFKHTSYLLLSEMCYMPYSPVLTTLLFVDPDDHYYAFVVKDLTGFELGRCYEAECIGDYICSVSREGVEASQVSYIPYKVLSSHMRSFGIWPSIVFVLLGIGVLFTKYNISVCIGVVCILVGVCIFPWPIHKNLTSVALRHSKMYKDCNHNFSYVFCFADKYGNTYYFSTDDRKAFEKYVTYNCLVAGRRILAVDQANDFYTHHKAKYPERTYELLVLAAFLLTVSIIIQLLGVLFLAKIMYSLLIVFLSLGIAYHRYSDDSNRGYCNNS